MPKSQERNSRIEQTKRYIFEETSTSLLNNKKWHSILDKTQNEGQSCKIKLLLSDRILMCDFIREVEMTSALFDDTGNFVEFLEIEYITINTTENMLSFLNGLKVNFSENLGEITIMGYVKRLPAISTTLR